MTMSRIASLRIASLMAGAGLLAMATVAQAGEPLVLTERQLDDITAGNAVVTWVWPANQPHPVAFLWDQGTRSNIQVIGDGRHAIVPAGFCSYCTTGPDGLTYLPTFVVPSDLLTVQVIGDQGPRYTPDTLPTQTIGGQ